MRRDYVIKRPSSDDRDWYDVDGKDYLARTVYEDHELIDIGITDAQGNPIMARRRMDQIGFVRWPEK